MSQVSCPMSYVPRTTFCTFCCKEICFTPIAFHIPMYLLLYFALMVKLLSLSRFAYSCMIGRRCCSWRRCLGSGVAWYTRNLFLRLGVFLLGHSVAASTRRDALEVSPISHFCLGRRDSMCTTGSKLNYNGLTC